MPLDAEKTNLRWEVSTEDAYRSPTAAGIMAELSSLLGFADDHLELIETALHEAILNAVIHGNLQLKSIGEEFGNQNMMAFESFFEVIETRLQDSERAALKVTIVAEVRSDALTLSVRDQGNGYDVHTVNAPKQAAGRGLLIIRSVADALRFEDDGRCITMVFWP